MRCFAQSEKTAGCGPAAFVWAEPGNERAGSVFTVLCGKHADRARTNGAIVLPLRKRTAA